MEYIEFDDDIDPNIMYMDNVKTIAQLFLITLKNNICQCCDCKLTYDGTVDFNLNNTIQLKSRNMNVAMKGVGIVREVYGKSASILIIKIKEFALELDLIYNIFL